MASYAQKEAAQDTTQAKVTYHKADTNSFERDTVIDHDLDVSPLDIGGTRGIFILSADRMLQLRILGSIRTAINYSDQAMQDYQTFNPYEVPTNVDTRSPNYFAGLQQSRIGIEVTRRTNLKGDVFIRLEGDFKNSSKTFRIRHAYGQVRGVLVGQSWSLMNNVSYQPAIVSLDGPACGIGLRTPQIRYTRPINNYSSWSAAVEYSPPEFNVPDSVDVTVLQVVPTFTGRYSYFSKKLSFRLAALISTISGREEGNDISYAVGYGFSFAGRLKVASKSEIFLCAFGGKASAHFLDTFNGKEQDLDFNPDENKFFPLHSYGGYIAFEQTFGKQFSASASFGISAISNWGFQMDDAYSNSQNLLINIFWTPIEGSRLGMEFAQGRRWDKGGARGLAHRVSFLIYYDF